MHGVDRDCSQSGCGGVVAVIGAVIDRVVEGVDEDVTVTAHCESSAVHSVAES